MTRLADIRDLLDSFHDDGPFCECAQCRAGRELLAVVDSTLGDSTPEYEAAVAQVTSELFGEGTKARAKYEARAAAWRALA